MPKTHDKDCDSLKLTWGAAPKMKCSCSKIQKVKNIYFSKKGQLNCETGLVLELEDGTFLAHCSFEPNEPFMEISNPLTNATHSKT